MSCFQEIEGVRSLGVASSAPIVESEGNLLIEYVDGSPCGSGQNRTKTKIHFRCRKGKLVSNKTENLFLFMTTVTNQRHRQIPWLPIGDSYAKPFFF